MPTLSEAFELWRTEIKGYETFMNHGNYRNEKIARYYEVRAYALADLCNKLFRGQ